MSLPKWMFSKLTIKVMIVSIIIFVLFMIFVLPAVSSYMEEKAGNADSPDTSFIYTADDIYKMANSYGEDGRKAYLVMRFTFDLVWPIVYLFFMLAVLINLLKNYEEKKRIRNLIYVPILGAVFDYLENIFAAVTVGRFPQKTPIVAEMTPIFTFIKWILLGIGFTAIFILIIVNIYKIIKNRMNK